MVGRKTLYMLLNVWIVGSPSLNVYSRTANSVKKRDRDGQRSGMAPVKEIILLYALIWKVVVEGQV